MPPKRIGLQPEHAHKTAFLGNKTTEKQATSPIRSHRFCKTLQHSPECSWNKCGGDSAWEEFKGMTISDWKRERRCWKPLVCSWLLSSSFTDYSLQDSKSSKASLYICFAQYSEQQQKKGRWNTTPLICCWVRHCPSDADGVGGTTKTGNSTPLFEVAAYSIQIWCLSRNCFGFVENTCFFLMSSFPR